MCDVIIAWAAVNCCMSMYRKGWFDSAGRLAALMVSAVLQVLATIICVILVQCGSSVASIDDLMLQVRTRHPDRCRHTTWRPQLSV